LVWRVVGDDTVGEGQWLVLKVETAALQSDAGTSRQHVAGDIAVLQNQRPARPPVGAEREGDVEDAAARALPLAPLASPVFAFTVELRSVNETARKIPPP
jgi:hypothetical protein